MSQYVPPKWERDVDGRPKQGAPCRYCGRQDQPDRTGRCNGCGAPHHRSYALDVTNIGSPCREYLWVPE